MTGPETLVIGVVQHPCHERPAENLELATAGIRKAAERGARLVVLPELHGHRYFCQTEDPAHFDLAEPVPGPTTEALAAEARRCRVTVVGSVFERRAPGLHHNTAVILDRDGALSGTYRKMHIPDDPGYYEKFYFVPGDQGFVPIDTSLGRIGVMVCWDQWYPEAARLMTLAGAEILLFPSAIGWDTADDLPERQRQLDSWITIQRGHAIANGVPVVCANRVGTEPASADGVARTIQFWGSSFGCGPQGEILWRAGDAPTLGMVEIDRPRTEQVRRVWPFLRDRRIDAYAGLDRRYGAPATVPPED